MFSAVQIVSYCIEEWLHATASDRCKQASIQHERLKSLALWQCIQHLKHCSSANAVIWAFADDD